MYFYLNLVVITIGIVMLVCILLWIMTGKENILQWFCSIEEYLSTYRAVVHLQCNN